MKISLPKLKAVLLYFCANTDPKFLGKVKLMKLFYFLDFGHIKKYGSPVTYDLYVNLEHGPIPSMIKNLVDEVCDDIDYSILADTISCETSDVSKMMRIVPKRKFNEEDKKYFSQTELEILENVCARFHSSNKKTIEDVSHSESPWRMTHLLDNIPYTLAVNDPDCQVSEDEIRLLSELVNA
jgi:uncharacterized phage-associated protein